MSNTVPLPLALAFTALATIATAAPQMAAGSGRVHGFACETCHQPAVAAFEPVRAAWARAGRPVATTPDASDSLVCLGCHDGTLSGDHARPLTTVHLGRDPLAEHPVGVSWIAARAKGLTGRPAPHGLPLFGREQRVECATCHDVHDHDAPHLLRVSTAGSELCLRCH